jgi:hypothetical protein
LLRTTALTVNAEWLDYGMISPEFGSHVCPSQPVEIHNVYFARTVLDVLDIRNGLGRREFLLDVEASPIFKNEPPTFPAPADRVPGQPVDASIEMHMTWARSPETIARYPSLKDGRDYDIHYRSSDATIAGSARIGCGDDGIKRECRGPMSRFAGLIVNYHVSQDQFPAPDEVSTDLSTESGAILQFDQRLREWLIGLERPR